MFRLAEMSKAVVCQAMVARGRCVGSGSAAGGLFGRSEKSACTHYCRKSCMMYCCDAYSVWTLD
jgi:hypothetical protein